MLKVHGAVLMQLWEAGIYFHLNWIGPFPAGIGFCLRSVKETSELVPPGVANT